MILTNDFIFIHFPKNAGSFVTQCLNKIYDGRTAKAEEKKITDYFYYLFDRERTNYSKKYMSKALAYTGEKIKTQHQGCEEIPGKHQQKPIVSTIRNPFDRYVSQYKFGWWKRNPVVNEERLKQLFPGFPDLSFSEYLDLVLNYNLENTKQKNDITLDIGIYSLYYIKLFGKNYLELLSSINSINELEEHHFYDADFLYQENLREDLFRYLKKFGWPDEQLQVIYEHNKVNTSRDDFSYREYYSQDNIDLIKEKEALIFNLFPSYSF